MQTTKSSYTPTPIAWQSPVDGAQLAHGTATDFGDFSKLCVPCNKAFFGSCVCFQGWGFGVGRLGFGKLNVMETMGFRPLGP